MLLGLVSRKASEAGTKSEQAGDLSVFVYVDFFGGRDFGKPGHRHDISGQGDDEAGAGGDLQIPDRDCEALGRTQECSVIGEGILSFGHTDGEPAKAQFCKLLRLLLRIWSENDTVGVST